MTKEKNSIAILLQEASEFNANDLLVNLNFESCFSYQNESYIAWDDLRKIILKSQILIKESGVNPLCLAKGAITWEKNGSKIQSPLLLIPTTFIHNKVLKTVEFEFQEDEVLLNPFVQKQLKTVYGISKEAPTNLDELIPFLQELGFNELDSSLSELGNFHHHRYELLKELENLSLLRKYPQPLQEILGINDVQTNYSGVISPLELLPTDDDHRVAFKEFEKHNIVVQGPPGTGKSQFLTNFIGKSLLGQKSMIVVSEKRSALEVITSKLKELHLDHLSFISTPDLSTKDFLQSLKKSWSFFEEFFPSKKSRVSIKKELEDNLQMTLNLLRQEHLIGGVSYSQFHILTKKVNLSKVKFQHRIPGMNIVHSQFSLIETIFNKDLQELIGSIQSPIVSNNHWNQIAENVTELLSISTELSSNFNIHTWGDLSQLMQKIVVCQLFENTIIEKHSKLLQPNSKEQKQFLRLARKYQAQVKEQNPTLNLSSWKTIPSTLEINVLLEQLKGNFWSKRRATKRWNQLSHLPTQKAELALNELTESNQFSDKLNEIEVQLLQLGLTDIPQEVPQIQNTIPLFTEDKWQDYSLLSTENKKSLLNIQVKLERFRVMIKHYFSFEEDVKLTHYFGRLQENLHSIIQISSDLKNLDSDCLFAFKTNPSFNEFITNVCGSHWSNFKKNYPFLSTFEMSDLETKINEILQSEELDQSLIVEQINIRVSSKFNQYNQLLSTPAQKLSEEEKELKKRLRKGKALLVKEFAKTKSHPSLRELFSSEAREWIQLLVPVWLSNPSQLAKCFPLEESLFDHCVFDEASQLLLHNGVGAIYRSNRIIIAGDDQQMGPTSFFKANSDEKISLLQQANHYLKRVTFRHHYRSQHPELIAFSNRHFYNNELKVFPSFGNEDNTIQLHKVEDGKFIDRQNQQEAKKVALLISDALKSSENIGVVAFSKEQVNCIWDALSENDKAKLEVKIDRNEAFLKPLEKVQGDECEHLIISMAYGANEEGDFSLRMGPLNRASGRNRLNVLFSRASKKINFVCSVGASDFKLSENESINLLRDWLRYCEVIITNYKSTPTNFKSKSTNSSKQFPFDLHPKTENDQLTFSSIHNQLSTANELITVHRVLSNRGWKPTYSI